MDSRHLARIERAAGVDGLAGILAERLSPSDLQSLLLEVHRRRAEAVTPAQLLRRYGVDRFGRPSDVAPAELHALDGAVFPVLDQAGFSALALSPVCPLGTVSALSNVPQNNVITTGRGGEVVADATNVLALECASRRRDGVAGDGVVRVAASQRVVRAQPDGKAGRSPHFVLLALGTAGRDIGGFGFETAALAGQLAAQLRLLEVLGRKGYRFGEVEVRLTDLSGGGRKAVLDAGVLGPLAADFPDVDFGYDDERVAGRDYYRDVSLGISARDERGERITFGDGGFVDWTARLLGNAKERLLTAGLGLELVHRLFRREDG